MPQIVVRTSGVESKRGAEVMRERVVASDLESEQFASQLVERIGWALADADTIEESPPRAGDGPAARRAA
jgi:hypothetical protein